MTLVNAETGEIVGRSLVECEQVIERGLTTFIEVGQALMEIRDGRLYKATHSDFDTYCRERWGWSRQRSDQIIGAAEVVDELTTTVVTPLPSNEAQVRPLTPLPTPEARREAWAESARLVRQAAKREVKDVLRSLTEDDDDAQLRLPGIGFPSVIAIAVEGDFIYKPSAMCDIDELRAGRATRAANVVAAQAKLDKYDADLDRVTPVMDGTRLKLHEAARMLMGPTSARPLPPMGGGPHPGPRDGTG